MSIAVDLLRAEIAQREQALEELRRDLARLLGFRDGQGTPAKERDVRGKNGDGPSAMTLVILGEAPEGLTVAQLRDELLKRGLLHNTKEPHKNARSALDQLLKSGRVEKFQDGRTVKWRLVAQHFDTEG